MSTTILNENSTMTSDDVNNFNQNQNVFPTAMTSNNSMVNELQQQQEELKTNQTRKLLSTTVPHRDLSLSPVHLTGTSSLSQAVHAALANVVQDPLLTGAGDSCSSASIHRSIHGDNNGNRCENCSKLRQQLTLLIYEVLNLENTMESKICDYVQRRLSEIGIAEQLSSSTILHNSSPTTIASETVKQSGENLDQKYPNPNPIGSENPDSNGCTNDNNQQSIKYRSERTLTFENVLIGDSTLKYLDPARFDIERKTYIKTMRGKRVAQALEFIQTTRFIGTKKIMFHIGTNDLNRDKLSEQEVSEQIKELIVTTKTVSPQSEVYISLIFPRQTNDESRLRTDKLNCLLQAMGSPELKVFIITHENISHDTRGCFEDSSHLSKAKGTMLFEENIKKAMGLKKSTTTVQINNQRLTSLMHNNQLSAMPTVRFSSLNPLGLKLSGTNTTTTTTTPSNYNVNNNALMNANNFVNMNMFNANALSAYLSFLVGGFRS